MKNKFMDKRNIKVIIFLSCVCIEIFYGMLPFFSNSNKTQEFNLKPSNHEDSWTKVLDVNGRAISISNDTQENIYILYCLWGSGNYIIEKYNTSGELIFKKELRYGACEICVDFSNNLHILSNSFLVKYNNSGMKIWNKTLDFESEGLDISFDSKNNILVLGNSFIVKFDENGNHLWNTSILVSYYGDNFKGNVIALDSLDNIVVSKVYDYDKSTITKYNVSGMLQWTHNFSKGAISDLALDKNDNIFVVAKQIVIKYDNECNQLWNRTIVGGASNTFNYESTSLCTDSSGNIIIATNGRIDNRHPDILFGNLFQGHTTYGFGAYLYGFDRSGDLSFFWRINGCYYSWINDMIIDAKNNTYIFGGRTNGIVLYKNPEQFTGNCFQYSYLSIIVLSSLGIVLIFVIFYVFKKRKIRLLKEGKNLEH